MSDVRTGMHPLADALPIAVAHAQGMVHSPRASTHASTRFGHPRSHVDGDENAARLMRSRAEQLRRQAHFVPDVAGRAFRRRACELELAATVVG